MKKKVSFELICLLASAIMVACGPSQAERDAQATKIAADTFATQTAGAPTPTNTPTATPTKPPTITPTLTPMPTPIPPQVPDWDTATLKRICVEVEQIFPGCSGVTFDPVDSVVDIRRVMENVGVSVSGAGSVDDSDCDALLTVNVTRRAFASQYESSGNSYQCYTGQEMNGKMVLTAPGLPTLTADISERFEGSKTVLSCPEAPCDKFGTSSNFPNIWDEMLPPLWGMTMEEFLEARELYAWWEN